MKLRTYLLCSLMAMLPVLLAGCRPDTAKAGKAPAKADRPVVFVPCGMIEAFRAVQEDFKKSSGIDFKATFDNAPVLLNRLRAGEKCDVLVSPGRLEMEQMEKEQKVDPASVVTFGKFKLIVVVPKKNPAGIQSWRDLTSPKVKAIGVAEASQNSVGWYADQALTKLGLLKELEPKIQRNWHAKTAVDWVCNGRVDAGIYFDACPFESGPEKVEGGAATYHIVGELPEDSYPPIQVQAGRVVTAGHGAEADKLLKWLLSEEGRQTLGAHGIPAPAPSAVNGGKS